MISQLKQAANRLNAAQSTGPRTKQGKARSSRNAAKHGFSAKRGRTSRVSRTDAIVLAIVDEYGDRPEVEIEALRLAEARLELDRVRCAQALAFNAAATDPRIVHRGVCYAVVQSTETTQQFWVEKNLSQRTGMKPPFPAGRKKQRDHWPELYLPPFADESEREAAILKLASETVRKLARYERRALNLRNKAYKNLERIRIQRPPTSASKELAESKRAASSLRTKEGAMDRAESSCLAETSGDRAAPSSPGTEPRTNTAVGKSDKTNPPESPNPYHVPEVISELDIKTAPSFSKLQSPCSPPGGNNKTNPHRGDQDTDEPSRNQVSEPTSRVQRRRPMSVIERGHLQKACSQTGSDVPLSGTDLNELSGGQVVSSANTQPAQWSVKPSRGTQAHLKRAALKKTG